MAIALGFQLAQSPLLRSEATAGCRGSAFLGVLVVAAGVLAADIADPSQAARHDHGRLLRHDHRPVSHLRLPARAHAAACRRADAWLADWLQLALATIVCYTCISMLAANEERLPLHHSLRRVRQGSQGAEAVRARYQRRDRRADRRHRRDARHRQPTHHAAVRDRRVAGHRRLERQAQAQPRPPRPRYSQPAAQRSESRS